jgi:transposase InsO family protein
MGTGVPPVNYAQDARATQHWQKPMPVFRIVWRLCNWKLHLAASLDLFLRFVVGWAISAVNDRRLTLKALEMAVARRCPDPGPCAVAAQIATGRSPTATSARRMPIRNAAERL